MIPRSPTAKQQGFAHAPGAAGFAFARAVAEAHGGTDGADAAVSHCDDFARSPSSFFRFGPQRAEPVFFRSGVRGADDICCHTLKTCGIFFAHAQAGVKSDHNRNQTRGTSACDSLLFLRPFPLSHLRAALTRPAPARLSALVAVPSSRMQPVATLQPAPLSVALPVPSAAASLACRAATTDLTSAPQRRIISTTRTIRAHRPGGLCAFRARAAHLKRG